MIAQDSINEVLERASLIEVVGEGVQLKRQGSSMVGLCPFHSEKSPSFHVRDDKFYHCFGCGVSGNAISYVMRARGLAFPEAVEELAARLGIQLRFEGRTSKRTDGADKGALYRVNQLAATFYIEQYRRAGAPAAEYLKERSVLEEAQHVFQLGFATRERDALFRFLRAKGVPETLILQSGLARRSERGDLYDTFRARIMFPILSDNKHVAGFGGRLIPRLVDDGVLTKAPKYLNSSDTPVYHKQAIFYGLPQALPALRESREVYLVEGYLDVIGLWQVGVRNVLATCGTAVSEQHIRRLKHLTRRVSLLFDGDQAGRAAAGKSYPVFLNSGLDVAAVFLPAEDDPDTFALRYGTQTAEELRKLPHVPMVECYVDWLMSRTGATSTGDLGAAAKGRLCEELAPVLRSVQNTIEQSELIQRAAHKLMVDPELLGKMVRKEPVSRSMPPKGAASESAKDSVSRAKDGMAPEELRIPAVEELPRLDRELLCALIGLKDELPAALLRDPDLCQGVHPATFRFARALDSIVREESSSLEDKKEALKELLEQFGESWTRIWKQAYQMAGDPEVRLEKVYEQCRTALKRFASQAQMVDLDRRIAAAPSEQARMELTQEKLSLKRQLQKGAPGLGQAQE